MFGLWLDNFLFGDFCMHGLLKHNNRIMHDIGLKLNLKLFLNFCCIAKEPFLKKKKDIRQLGFQNDLKNGFFLCCISLTLRFYKEKRQANNFSKTTLSTIKLILSTDNPINECFKLT